MSKNRTTAIEAVEAFVEYFKENGIEMETPEMKLARSLALYVLVKWQHKSSTMANPPLYFSNMYEKGKTQALGHILVVLEHMVRIVKNDKETIKA